ncbi:hypothetical protein H6F38_14535 [Paenibacillus sp. EKM208P]|nr:hypothetical protein H6F38_14535 [Paenibacillus sp. EKM208P]
MAKIKLPKDIVQVLDKFKVEFKPKGVSFKLGATNWTFLRESFEQEHKIIMDHIAGDSKHWEDYMLSLVHGYEEITDEEIVKGYYERATALTAFDPCLAYRAGMRDFAKVYGYNFRWLL